MGQSVKLQYLPALEYNHNQNDGAGCGTNTISVTVPETPWIVSFIRNGDDPLSVSQPMIVGD
jgi:hypothetical protein